MPPSCAVSATSPRLSWESARTRRPSVPEGLDDGPSFLAQAVALAVYIALGYFLKSVVLNWIVGPLFLVMVLHVVPRAFRRRRETS